MSRKVVSRLALCAAAALALAVAAPAHACKDCECARKAAASEKKPEAKPEAKPDAKPGAKPPEKSAGDKKAEAATCECAKGGKGCTCKKGECRCPNCGQGSKLVAR